MEYKMSLLDKLADAAGSFFPGTDFLESQRSVYDKAQKELRAASQRIAEDQDPVVQQRRLEARQKQISEEKVSETPQQILERAGKDTIEFLQKHQKFQEDIKKFFENVPRSPQSEEKK